MRISRATSPYAVSLLSQSVPIPSPGSVAAAAISPPMSAARQAAEFTVSRLAYEAKSPAPRGWGVRPVRAEGHSVRSQARDDIVTAVGATRASVLAMWQTRHVIEVLAGSGIVASVLQVATKGDLVQDRLLAALGTDGI